MNSMNFTSLKTMNQPYIKQPNILTIKPYRSTMNSLQTITPPSANSQLAVEIKPKDEAVKPMKWGQPIWFLFHTLSHKVKEESFPKIRVELLNHLYNICNNLPCPTCASHAVEYLNGVNFNSIQRKEDLKYLFFSFHNSVNERKGFSIFPYSELNEKYENAVTKNIIYYFIQAYQDKHKSIHMIANDMYRARQVIVLKEWFNANIQHFDP